MEKQNIELQDILTAQKSFIETSQKESTELKNTVEQLKQELKGEIQELQIQTAKAKHVMNSQEKEKTVELNTIFKSIQTALQNGERGELKGIFTSVDAERAPLYVQGWETEIIKNLKDYSPLLSVTGIRGVPARNGLRKRVQTTKMGSRVGVENVTNSLMSPEAQGSFEWIEPQFIKLECFTVFTNEALREGELNMQDVLSEVQESFGIKAALYTLKGGIKDAMNKDFLGIMGYFGDETDDDARVYNKFQTHKVPANFGTDYKVTVSTLQKVRRSLNTPYRNGSVWFMNEETFDALSALVDASGRPLIQTLMTNDYDGSILGYPVVIDRTMPGLSDKDAVAVMFGDFKRAVTVFGLPGVHKVDSLAIYGGNTHLYDSYELGLRIEHNHALKGLRTAK